MESLDRDTLSLVLYATRHPTVRRICHEWRDVYDACLRRDCEVRVRALLQSCAILSDASHVPVGTLLTYASDRCATRMMEVECGRCHRRHTNGILGCNACRRTRRAFPWSHTAPAMALAAVSLMFYST